MRLSELFDAVLLKLKNDFPAVKNRYGEEVKQGMKFPAFFVYLLPIVDSNETEHRRYQRVTVKIVYMTEKHTNAEYRDMTDDLNDAFKLNFPVGNRVLSIFDKTTQTIGDALHFSFDVSAYSLVFQDDYFTQYDMMGELHINLEKEG
ncbi:hypothetical protein ACH33_08690 [Aneurinibacillus sp. XH2]|uniref:phage tail terminator family protein n=1 Tax=Aneurinibacillus sp. XH2 TaxID=1450761 RepID=UPI0007088FAC|nr:hypothetical protein [Aneurinibacillus sp. XH2]AMA72927.1 hypothetical protein ACH33_08690 [Aneurinibacillus sp. XH2]